MRLQGALDQEVHVAVQKFITDGVPADVISLYTALARSNSSLKRRPKKVLQGSIERVLDFIGFSTDVEVDSDEMIEDAILDDPSADIMNRSLRANLGASRSDPAAPSPLLDDRGGKKRKPNGEALPKRQKRSEDSTAAPINVSFEDVGGMDHVIHQLTREVIMPFTFSADFHEGHVPLPRGVMLHGPPGCGKTMLSRALAAEMGVAFVEILGPAIVSGMSGESEKGVREKFEEAKRNAPCLVFIDEIDAIAPKRDTSQSQMEKRIVAQLLVCMDELQQDPDKPVMVLAATNRPDSIDPALRRGGRFGIEINIGVPNEDVRKHILQTQTRNMTLDPDVDFTVLAKATAGFVGSDLHDLVGKAGSRRADHFREALVNQVDNVGLPFIPSKSPAIAEARKVLARGRAKDMPRPAGFEVLFKITMSDFLTVLPGIVPSGKREGFTTIPEVSWKDVGALDSVRKELEATIVEPIENPELFEKFGIHTPSGVLLWGPPGCGKTLLAKAVAAESKANFISIRGPELLNKFVGESEAAVRKVFQRARSSVPCVIFFDELDALVPRRDESGSEVSSRVVNTLLTELDGMSPRAGIFVVAATNRPEMIDEAMLRPGRLGTQLFIDVPGPDERVDIMRAMLRGKPCEFTPQMAAIIRDRCLDFSGADLGALLQQAARSAGKRRADTLELEDFEYAQGHVRGSVQDVAKYRKLKARFAR
jgi:ribosome biogenesis ATPase